MSGKYNIYLIVTNIQFISTVILIVAQFLEVHSRILLNEPAVLLSSKEMGEITFPVEAPSITGDCEKTVVCDHVTNYPTELVGTIIHLLSLKNITTFRNDRLHGSESTNNILEIQDLCKTKNEKIIFPRAAKDQYQVWQFILNMHGSHFQSFRVHECLDVPASSCYENAHVNEDYRLECEQLFTKREMIYLNLEKKVVKMDHFLVPSCCSCYLRKSRI